MAHIYSSRADAPAAAGARPCGLIHLASAVRLADPRYSVDEAQALALGPVRLEALRPPERALEVDGRWPGEAGYPLDRVALLRLARPPRDSGDSSIPAELSDWARAAGASADAASRASSPFTIAAAGDFQVRPARWATLSSGEAGLERLLDPGILAALRSASIAVANLEAPIAAGGEPNPRKRYRFLMPPGSSAALRAAGFDLVLAANNHTLDYGRAALSDTLRDLDSAGVAHVGAGADGEEASAPRLLEAGGESLAFFGFAFYSPESLGFSVSEARAGAGRPGVAADTERSIELVREAARAGRTVVVLAHGGSEYVESPDPSARSLYARFAEAGAALVIGSHPHELQGCAAAGQALVAYSLGNFVFTGLEQPPEARRSAVLEFLLYRGRVRGVRLYPILVGEEGSVLDPDRAGAEERFSGACAALSSRG